MRFAQWIHVIYRVKPEVIYWMKPGVMYRVKPEGYVGI